MLIRHDRPTKRIIDKNICINNLCIYHKVKCVSYLISLQERDTDRQTERERENKSKQNST